MEFKNLRAEDEKEKHYIFEIVLRADIEEHTETIREYIEDTFGVEILEINQGVQKWKREIWI